MRRRGSIEGDPLLEGRCLRKCIQLKDVGVQTAIPSREYVGPRARASQAPEFLKQGWVHRPKTVSTLCVALALIFVAAQIMSGQQSTRRQRLTWGSLAALFIFLVFGTLQLPDGLLVRPSPIFWRFVKSCSIVYLLFLSFLLFQDLKDIRSWIHSLDPEAGVPLEERNYAEKCSSWESFLDKLDLFVWAHFLGWLIKALVIRDTRLLWTLSILFEFMEISFRHILPNFAECWWDHLILDIFGCNLLGIMLGQYLCRRFQMLHYDWHAKYTKPLLALGGSATKSFSFRYSGSGVWTPPATDTTQDQTPAAAASSSPLPTSPAGSIHRMQETVSPSQQQQQQQEQQQQQLHERRKTSPVVSVKDALKTFMPYELTAYHWPAMLESAKTFTGIVFFCVVVTLLDLNVFFLKAEFFLPSHHWTILARLALFSLAAAAGTREFYSYLTDDHCSRMGVQCWLDLAMVATEALLAFKFYFFEGALQPHDPCPTWILVCWIVVGLLLFSTICLLLLCPPSGVPPTQRKGVSLEQRSKSTSASQSGDHSD